MKKHVAVWSVIIGGLVYLDHANEEQIQVLQDKNKAPAIEGTSSIHKNDKFSHVAKLSFVDNQVTRDGKNHSSQLWQSQSNSERPENFPADAEISFIKVNENLRRKFSEGEKVALLIPQENKVYEGQVVSSTKAFSGEVNMTEGKLENGNPFASFSITSDSNTTLATVATGESIYQIEIDNQTGVGFVMDDRELDSLKHPEDGILPPPEGVS